MTRRALRIGGLLALLAGVLAAAAAVTVGAVGVLALAGTVTYPADLRVGPFSVQATLTTPVELDAGVCQEADVLRQDVARECLRFFVHDEQGEGANGQVRAQDADIRPAHAALTGEADLVTTGGWSPFVAANVAVDVLELAGLAVLLVLVSRLLAAAASGESFSDRTVRHLRGIGWLVIAGALLAPAADHVTSAGQLGYQVESFGVAPHLLPVGSAGYPDGIDLWQLALGGLSLLLAEVFRHGAEIETERRLTV